MKIYQVIKPVIDFVFAVLLTLLLLPLFLIISLIIKLDSKGPVLFRQKRIGKDGKIFTILKYRTMRTDTPKDMPTHLFQDAESFITKSGQFLRKSSLDELPQLFNVLRGEMSFIGPRPALWNQYDLQEERDAQSMKFGIRVNSFRPGITGWAQVNGRDELPINLKAELDGYYAKNISFFLDIKILFLTIVSVFTTKGVSEGGPKH